MALDSITFVRRLRALLPKGWFSEDSPILGALLTALADPWVGLSNNIDYVSSQTRIQTATDIWLDLAGADYLGSLITRQPGETDDAYRCRIRANLLTSAGTRCSLMEGVAGLADATAQIFEPTNCSDTGAYGDSVAPLTGPVCRLAYGLSGGWGSLNLPYQVFITVATKPLPGEATPIGYGVPGGGYSAGSLVYNDITDVPGTLTDDEVRIKILRLVPVNCTAWIRFV